MMEDSSNVDVIYSDFEKAYDKVDHKELVNKMTNKFKVKGKLLKWIENFLKDRKQQVLVEGSPKHPKLFLDQFKDQYWDQFCS